MVRRDVVEVVTPGLRGDPDGIESADEVALASLFVADGEAGLAVLEAVTGDFRATATAADAGLSSALLEELGRVARGSCSCRGAAR